MAMSAQQGSARFRYSTRELMIIVAVAAIALTWVNWRLRPRPFPVSGTIFYNGQPVGNGKIVFLPPGPTGQQASGQIISGKFSLTSFALNDGAMAGTYDIVVVSPGVPAKYRSRSTSGLIVHVQKTANTMDFILR
jgi:hypothetical protein